MFVVVYDHLSTKATSIAPVTLDVVKIKTFECLNSQCLVMGMTNVETFSAPYFLMRSICVRKALTTRIASDGSVPLMAALRAAVRLSTFR